MKYSSLDDFIKQNSPINLDIFLETTKYQADKQGTDLVYNSDMTTVENLFERNPIIFSRDIIKFFVAPFSWIVAAKSLRNSGVLIYAYQFNAMHECWVDFTYKNEKAALELPLFTDSKLKSFSDVQMINLGFSSFTEDITAVI